MVEENDAVPFRRPDVYIFLAGLSNGGDLVQPAVGGRGCGAEVQEKITLGDVVQRGLDALRDDEQEMSPDEYLRRAALFANQLMEIGGRRDSWMMLQREHHRLSPRATPLVVLETGNALCRMMLDDHAPAHAIRKLQVLQSAADSLETRDPIRIEWLRLFAEALVEQCAYEEGVTRIRELIALLPHGTDRDRWAARLTEIQLLQGDLGAATASLAQDDQS